MTTKKKELASFKSELHMISSLPIEVFEQRIASLSSDGLFITIEKPSDDVGDFRIKNKKSGKLEVFGRFLRWNGTFTRIDIDSKDSRQPHGLSPENILGVVVLLLIFGILWPVYMSFLAFPFIFFIVTVLGLVGLAFFIGSYTVLRTFSRSRDGDFDSRKARDQMIQSLVNKLTENREEILEFDGSELSLEMLISEEKYKHFRIGADGEISSP